MANSWQEWLQGLMDDASVHVQHPVAMFKQYERRWFSADLLAGLTVAFVMLPQSIAFALIADLPPQTGVYAAIVAAIVGALWGSSSHLHSGPTNTTSLLVLSALAPIIASDDPAYVGAAALLAVMVGIIRLLLGLARLGALLNFVSDSVIVGFSAGAAVLICVNQLRHLLGLTIPSDPLFVSTIWQIVRRLGDLHWLTVGVGLAAMLLVSLLKRFAPKVPATLVAIVLSSLAVGLFRLDQQGVAVLGELPRSLPPFSLPTLDYALIRQLSVGAFAIALVGLMEAISISQTIASESGERLDSDQEFIGQGLANIVVGFFSGYPCSGSFTRSAINYDAGAKSGFAAIFSGLFLLLLLLLFAPYAAFLPRAALAAIIILAAVRLINRAEIQRIWRGSRADAIVLVATLLSTLFLPLEFAILAGILVSFVTFVNRTAKPTVLSVVPDANFQHLRHLPSAPECPQIAIITISGALYFGATTYVEDTLRQRLADFPEQKYILMRMHRVHYLDISGINLLKTIVTLYRENGGDVYMTAFTPQTWDRLVASGFVDWLGSEHVLPRQQAITQLYAKVIDPIRCIYACPHRVYEECADVPKVDLGDRPVKLPPVDFLAPIEYAAPTTSAAKLNGMLERGEPLMLIDVRSKREWREEGYIVGAQQIPLYQFFGRTLTPPPNTPLVILSRGGRRSYHLVHYLDSQGIDNVYHLDGGMLGWQADGYPLAEGDVVVRQPWD